VKDGTKLKLEDMRPLGAKAPLAVTLDVDSSVFTCTLLLEVVVHVSRVLQE
jgi:hypothetical protein